MVNEFGDDISKYVFNISNYEQDDEILELKQFGNPREVEMGVHFSKNGLVGYFEQLLEEYNPLSEQKDEKTKWDLGNDDKDSKIFTKKEKEAVTTYGEVYYPKNFLLHEVAQCLLNPKFRKQWDK